MTDAAEVLFNFAIEKQMDIRLLPDEHTVRAYTESKALCQRKAEALKTRLGTEAFALVEDFINDQNIRNFYEDQILFRQGLSMGLSLAGLMD